ncbi:PPOX class F420-dependent oxidoreductase [Chloroflexia bacterium SDU3-3]|nr:PPOX class F420-dependent oxidoreductase [Chloroflexia bacterium SDU3-3]
MTARAEAFPTLQGHEFVNLTTYRKSGAAVVTPVWFAQVGATLYVVTQDGSGKVKRLRANPMAQLAPATRRGEPLGQPVPAQGRILGAAEAAQASQALDKKYGWQKRLFDVFAKLRGSTESRVYLAFEPADA